MLVRIEAQPDEVVVFAEGEIDMATAPSLSKALAEARAHDGSVVVCDLAAVSFMDSSGLTVLLTTRADLAPGERLVLRDPSEAVTQLLTVAGLGDVFEVRAEETPGD